MSDHDHESPLSPPALLRQGAASEPAAAAGGFLLGQPDDDDEADDDDESPALMTTTPPRMQSKGQGNGRKHSSRRETNQTSYTQDSSSSSILSRADDEDPVGDTDARTTTTPPPAPPLCSVLNTVVDFVMMPPSEHFEPEEYQQQQQQQQQPQSSTPAPLLQVPVLRFFGPMVRRSTSTMLPDPNTPSTNSKTTTTTQNTATKATTGDHPTPQQQQQQPQSACLYVHGAFPYLVARPAAAGPDGGSSGGDCPWDSPDSVRRMLPGLRETLEAALREMTGSAAAANNTNNNASSSSTPQLRVIRQLTVVSGRGFYTYCPGAAAPFVRVEYYAPADRWKVKRCLERGLADLPVAGYHPVGAGRQNRGNQDNDDNGEDDVLRFHCYEAHIPYTMQFFKDWNLAGLSYIHVAAAAAGVACGKFRCPLPRKARNKYIPTTTTKTAAPRRGEKPNTTNEERSSSSSFLFLSSNTPQEYQWTTVAQQQQQQLDGVQGDVEAAAANAGHKHLQTKMTSCDIELDIHVSSILNVRDVMTELPSAAEDELASSVHWRSVPSLREIWTQERRRMARLLPPQEDFLSSRGATQPQQSLFTLDVKRDAALPGARLACEGMRRLVRVTQGLDESFRRAMKQILERHVERVNQADARARERTAKTLAGARAGGDGDDNNYEDGASMTPSYDEAMEALGALGNLFEGGRASQNSEQEDTGGADGNLSQESTQSSNNRSSFGRFESLSQEFSSSRRKALIDKEHSLRDEFMLSQRVERGDGIVVDGPFQHIDDVIDPETLAPYEAIGEDDEDEQGDDENDEALDEQTLERELATMATQTMGNVCAVRGNSSEGKDDNDESSVESIDLLAGRSKSHRHDIEAIEFDEDEEPEVGNDLNSALETCATNANPEPLKESAEHDSSLLSDQTTTSFRSWEHPADISISLRELPPTKGEIVKSAAATTLFPKSAAASNEWTAFLAEYEGIRRRNSGRSDLTWFPLTTHRGVEVQPVRAPPTRKAVEAWLRKEIRKRKAEMDGIAKLNKRRKSGKEGKPKNPALNLKIDENSRKLVVDPEIDPSRPQAFEVEEVEWESSQQVLLSAATQEVEPDSIACDGARESKEPCSQSSREANSKDPCSQSSRASSDHFQSSSGPTADGCTLTENPSPGRALQGIGNQGGRIWVEGGGQLKAKTKQTQTNAASIREANTTEAQETLSCPVTVMAIEVHIQCREGQAGVNDSRKIALTPDSDRDRVLSVVSVFGRDPGGGEAFEFLERICVFIPLAREVEKALTADGRQNLDNFPSCIRRSIPQYTMGVSIPFSVECVKDERQLLLRFASIVRMKDPDMLLSWDTQGSGLGYLIKRGAALGKNSTGNDSSAKEIDMARLLGRTPRADPKSESDRLGQLFRSEDATGAALAEIDEGDKAKTSSDRWKGSGLGSEWDERVGAGAAAASISGRLVFAAWKLIADEVKHPNCSYLPAVVSSVLSKRIPHHDNLKLAQWYGHDSGRERWRVIHHRLAQCVACLQLFDALDIIGRSGEAARLSGVEFSQSFPGIRGSQYKVEGVLLRALQSLNSDERGSKKGRKKLSGEYTLSGDSKSQTQSPWKARRFNTVAQEENDAETESIHCLSDRCYFFFSPSLHDTTKQEALETQALTLEPLSGHQHDPVVVCDFTALYPSLVIAYNLCYSTCAGKLDYHSTRNEMRLQGRTTGKVGPVEYAEERTATVLKHHMKSLGENTSELKDRAYIAPTGTIFVSESVVKGVLPQVLDEMLSTRAMLKKAAKQYKKLVPDLSPSILRQLEARQLALKYVANVTYGYTSATFSGRCAMPLLADTIVECGRRTLTNAINMANIWGRDPNGRWRGAEVIYGDTDSLFIKLPGRSVQEAFLFGEEFCKAVTESNPPPVQLKLEKVYLGSMMQTKKKYCGMKFESKDQKKPEFEAKGLEIIRRDQCSLTQKVLRNTLVTLYRSGIEAVKAYLFRQWALILSGRLPVSDFILTGRVRSRYRGGRVGPVQAVLARRLAEADPGRVVRHKERQAYVIVASPGVAFKLQDCVLTPMELLEQWDSYTIHAGYYIKRHVNSALQRCLGLEPYRVNVAAWFESSPKPRQRIHFWPSTRSKQSTMMISTFFGSDKCSLCGRKCAASGLGRAAVCHDCQRDPVKAVEAAMRRLNATQRSSLAVAKKCSSCNLCFEDASTFAVTRSARSSRQATFQKRATLSTILVTPLANCTCIDCPVTFERHRLRESELEATAVSEALNTL